MAGGDFGVDGVELALEDGLDLVELGGGGLAEAGGLDGDGGEAGAAAVVYAGKGSRT